MVRGGTIREPDVLLKKIEKGRETDGIPSLSVFAAAAEGLETKSELLFRICLDADMRYGQVQVSTVARLESSGFPLVPDQEEGANQMHYHVEFKADVDIADAERFIQAFGSPTPNPAKGSLK